MDEIEIFFNGVCVFSFFETSLMMCGSNRENSALFDVAEKILPAFVWDSFLEWHKHSSWDGDNETVIALWAFSTSCMLFLALILLIIYSICGD